MSLQACSSEPSALLQTCAVLFDGEFSSATACNETDGARLKDGTCERCLGEPSTNPKGRENINECNPPKLCPKGRYETAPALPGKAKGCDECKIGTFR